MCAIPWESQSPQRSEQTHQALARTHLIGLPVQFSKQILNEFWHLWKSHVNKKHQNTKQIVGTEVMCIFAQTVIVFKENGLK